METRPGQGTFVTRWIDPFVTVLTANPESGDDVRCGGRQRNRATSATPSGLAYSRSISSRVRKAQVREVDELERRHNASVGAC